MRYGKDKYVFGGYIKDEEVRFESTSGGAFSAIVDTFCDDNYVIFGAESKGLLVWHSYITDKKNLAKFRKSKYSQSKMGKSYQQAKDFLNSGKKVLFSGTPCQISGLKAFLRNTNQDNLLTVEVICEGVPSPLYIRKYEQSLKKKFGALIESIDYRYKGHSFLGHHKWDFKIMRVLTNNILGMARWDFEIMRTTVMMNDNKKKVIEKDRWFNPFWYIWLKHLMSRPSCYECLFTTTERTADISLGDLWGVHIYCPEFMQVCKEKQITVLIDEAYHYFYPKTFIQYALNERHVFVTRTFSKLFSMAGCRLGYVVGHPDDIKYVQKFCTPHNTNAFAMLFAERILTTPGMVESLVRKFQEGRSYLISELDDRGYHHKGEAGNFLFIEPKTKAQTIVERMKNEKKILIKAYENVGEFGDCLHVSIGEKKYMQQFMVALLELDK